MNIAVFFGGRSCEHNISVATGVQAANVLAGNGHKVYCVYANRAAEAFTSAPATIDCALSVA